MTFFSNERNAEKWVTVYAKPLPVGHVLGSMPNRTSRIVDTVLSISGTLKTLGRFGFSLHAL